MTGAGGAPRISLPKEDTRGVLPLLRAVLLPLVLACAAAACGAVTPASGPPSYGDGRDRGGGP